MTGPGGVSRLEPKVMLVLVCLAEHAGQMVPKDQLFQSAWPDTAVTDDVLTRAVSELRRLFEDDPRQPRVIETIAKGGYRLIAPVEILPGHDEVVRVRGSAEGGTRWQAGATVRTVEWAAARRGRHRPCGVDPGERLAASSTANHVRAGHARGPSHRDERLGVRARTFRPTVARWRSPGTARLPVPRPVRGGRATGTYTSSLSEHPRCTDSRRVPAWTWPRVWSPDGRESRTYVSTRHRRRFASCPRSEDPIVRSVTSRSSCLPCGRQTAATWWQGERGDPAGPPKGLYLIPVHGGEPRAITRPRVSGQDLSPAFSPDGRRLAYISCPGPGPDSDCHLQLANLDAAFTLAGPPRQLAGPPYPGGRSGVTWSRDGRSVIFNATENQLEYLWRVGVEGQASPERIEQAGFNAFWPAISPSDDRLAFTRMFHDQDVYRFEPGRPVQPVAPSSLFDGVPQFSPDGRRIAFDSLRSGEAMEVWIANADGSSPAQLTHGPGRFQGGPSWSPDGRRIAFESAGEHAHIWTVDSEGGTPRQITNDPGDQMEPDVVARRRVDLLLVVARSQRPRHLADESVERSRRSGSRAAAASSGPSRWTARPSCTFRRCSTLRSSHNRLPAASPARSSRA